MKGLRLYVASGVLAALAFLCAAYLSIPYAGGGYFNFGDIVILLAAGLLGPYAGAFVGAVGGALADLSLGMAVFSPFSLVAKGGLGFLAGLFARMIKKKELGFLLGGFLGGSLEVLVYFLSYLLIYGTISVSSLFDCLQAYGSLVVSYPILLLLRRTLPKEWFEQKG